MENAPAPYPRDELHAAAPDAADQIDALHHELGKPRPDASTVEQHVGTLRKHASLGAIIESWLADERTSAFVNELSATGL